MEVSFIVVIIFVVAGAVLLALSFIVGKKSRISREKNSPFECGLDPVGSGRLPFSVRFFMIAVVFLVFDVEISLLLPLVVGMSRRTLAP